MMAAITILSLLPFAKLIEHLSVHHKGLHDRNVPWCEDLGRPMVIDFERADMHFDAYARKRKRGLRERSLVKKLKLRDKVTAKI